MPVFQQGMGGREARGQRLREQFQPLEGTKSLGTTREWGGKGEGKQPLSSEERQTEGPVRDGRGWRKLS